MTDSDDGLLRRLFGDAGERKWYDEFGVAHEFDPHALEAMLTDHNRYCLGCAGFDDGREVYTVALGISFGISVTAPVIFETSWKRHGEFQDVLDRYPTRRLAKAGWWEWLGRFEAGYPADSTPRPSGG